MFRLALSVAQAALLLSAPVCARTWTATETENHQTVTVLYRQEDTGPIQRTPLAFLNHNQEWQYYGAGKFGGYEVLKKIGEHTYRVNLYEQDGFKQAAIISKLGSDGDLDEVKRKDLPKGEWFSERDAEGQWFGFRFGSEATADHRYRYLDQKWNEAANEKEDLKARRIAYARAQAKRAEAIVDRIREKGEAQLAKPGVLPFRQQIDQGVMTPTVQRFHRVASEATPPLAESSALLQQTQSRSAFREAQTQGEISAHPVPGLEEAIDEKRPLLVLRLTDPQKGEALLKLVKRYLGAHTHSAVKEIGSVKDMLSGVKRLTQTLTTSSLDQARLYIDPTEPLKKGFQELYPQHDQLAANVAAVAATEAYARGAARADKRIAKRGRKGKRAPLAEKALAKAYCPIRTGVQEGHEQMLEACRLATEAGLWNGYAEASEANPGSTRTDIQFLLNDQESKIAAQIIPSGASIRYAVGNEFYYLPMPADGSVALFVEQKRRLDAEAASLTWERIATIQREAERAAEKAVAALPSASRNSDRPAEVHSLRR